jgi:DNA-directed RNA polymerase subunit omega
MARITVEDCLKKIDSQYDLVLLAKERTSQLNTGEKPLVPEDNDKNTVLSLREIGEGKISLKTVEDSAINKLRKTKNETKEAEDSDLEQEDDFDKIYKGEISKSGAAILPSKRVRKMPEKIVAEAVAEAEAEAVAEAKVKVDTETEAKIENEVEKNDVELVEDKVEETSAPAEDKAE